MKSWGIHFFFNSTCKKGNVLVNAFRGYSSVQGKTEELKNINIKCVCRDIQNFPVTQGSLVHNFLDNPAVMLSFVLDTPGALLNSTEVNVVNSCKSIQAKNNLFASIMNLNC